LAEKKERRKLRTYKDISDYRQRKARGIQVNYKNKGYNFNSTTSEANEVS